MEHLFQVECWEKNRTEGVHSFIMAKEIGQWNGKGFGKEKWHILAYLFMKIMENRRKGRWNVTCCMWGGKWIK